MKRILKNMIFHNVLLRSQILVEDWDDGEDLGEWDPTLYASLRLIQLGEIIAYQEFLNSLRKGWWNTRKARPMVKLSVKTRKEL